MISKIPIDKVKKIKELGHGIMGTVYLVSYKGKNYALKIEHLLPEDLEDKSSPLWNEIRFAEDVANSNPEHFMTLNNYDFVEPCDLKQEYGTDLSFFPEAKQKYLKKLAESPICVRKLYSLVDTTLDKLELKSLKEKYSMIIQMLYIVYLIHKKGYVHADLHPGNVGVVKTKKKYINILGHSIPTFGRIFQAIDYGGVLNKKTLNPKRHIMMMQETQKHIYDWALVFDKLGFMSFVDDRPFWNYMMKNNIKLDRVNDRGKILNAPEMKFIEGLAKDEELKFELFRILFPEKFQKIVLGKHFKKVIPLELNLPMEDILLFFIHFDDTKMLIDYFVSRL